MNRNLLFFTKVVILALMLSVLPAAAAGAHEMSHGSARGAAQPKMATGAMAGMSDMSAAEMCRRMGMMPGSMGKMTPSEMCRMMGMSPGQMSRMMRMTPPEMAKMHAGMARSGGPSPQGGMGPLGGSIR